MVVSTVLALRLRTGSALAAVFSMLFVWGCASERPADRTLQGAEIESFSAAPLQIVQGEGSTLSWKVLGASRVALRGGDQLIYESETEWTGLLELFPQTTTVYTLTATGARGDVERTLQIEVEPRSTEEEAPVIATFTADRATIQSDQDQVVTLSWHVVHASELALLANGEAVDLGERSLVADSIGVVTNEKAEFVLVATNSTGEARKELRIETDDPFEVVSFDAFPSRVAADEPFELEWKTRSAAKVEITIGEVLLHEVEGPGTGQGTFAQTISSDVTYTLKAYNAQGGWMPVERTVTVGPPEIEAFGPRRINASPGSPVEFRWTNLGGTSLRLLGPGGSTESICELSDVREIADGTCTAMAPSSLGSFTFTLVVENGAGEVRREAVLNVVDGPTIEDFQASPTAVDVGDWVTLSWRTERDGDGEVPSLLLTDDRGNPPYDLDGVDLLEGSIDLELTEVGSYTFTLEATTPGSTPSRRAVTVEVHEAAEVTLSASTERYDPAVEDEVRLSWSSRNAISLSIFALDEEGARIDPAVFVAGSEEEIAEGELSLDPYGTTTFVAVVMNEIARERVASVRVEVVGPEILSFHATPRNILENGPTRLEWVTANATFATLDPVPQFAISTRPLPYLPLSRTSGAERLPHDGHSCGGDEPPGCPLLVFPGEFRFPYDGATYDRANIFTSGLLSFDLTRDNTMDPRSDEALDLPVRPDGGTNETGWTQIIAPFWGLGQVNADEHEGAGIFYYLGTDASLGRYLAIEWNGIHVLNKRDACGPVNVNLVLWESGSFDFRYDIEEPLGKGPSTLCHGQLATIGFQYAEGTEAVVVSERGDVPSGGLGDKSWTFTPAIIEAVGGIELNLPSTETFTLTAYGAGGRTARETVTVEAFRQPSVTASIEPATVVAGESALMVWEAYEAVSLQVQDEEGVTVCEAAGADALRGSCVIKRDQPGAYVYSIVASNPAIDMPFPVSFQVWAPLELHSFALSPGERPADAPGPVTLSWSATGATSFRILEDGVDISDRAGSSSANAGSMVVNPTRTSRYTLELVGSDGLQIQRTETFVLRPFGKIDLAASALISDGDQPVTISWNVPAHQSGRPLVTMEPETFPMVEVLDAPFIDIADTGELLPESRTPEASVSPGDSSTRVDFPEGFTFPYFGVEQSGVYPSMAGYLAMMGNGTFTTNTPLLDYSGGALFVSIAPFWENLRSYAKGAIYSQFLAHPTDREKDQFIVQWDEVQLSKNPAPRHSGEAEDDLTFQVGLFRDGSIEFRYRTMESPTHAARAGGSGASIGFKEHIEQSALETPYFRGTQLFYKPANPINLSGRSFRYRTRTLVDSLEVTPGKTTDYRICVELAGFKECETVSVLVPTSGDLLITELNLDPAGGHAQQWFEVRNTTPHPFDLRGLRIVANAGEHVVAAETPIVAGPGDYLILGASTQPGVDYVYGELPLGQAVDSLRLFYGTAPLNEVSWDTSWAIPSGKTLGLDASLLRPHLASNDDFGRWCVGSAGGTPGWAESCTSAHYDLDPFSTRPFIDIAATGRSLFQPYHNHQVRQLPGGLGFTISYFGEEVDELWISADGFASVRPTEPRSLNERIPLPGAGGPGIIAPLWSNLQIGEGAFFYERREIDGEKVVILQWDRFVRPRTGVFMIHGSTTFQAQIWSNGDIVLAYGPISAIQRPIQGDDALLEHFGGLATVGLESIGGREGIEYLYQEPILREWQSLHFMYKQPGR